MGSKSYAEVFPPKLVHVRLDEVWRDGFLRGWQQHDGRWRGFVTYSVGVGMNKLEWVEEDGLRQDRGGRR